MGARLKEMVSYTNTNDIHHQILHPPLPLPNTSSQKIALNFSDTYGFTKFLFYNPTIKEFSTKLVNNLAYMYRSGIGHQRPFYARDL